MQFTPAELKIIEELKLKIPEAKETKIVGTEFKCKLCKTTYTQYIELEKQSNFLWTKKGSTFSHIQDSQTAVITKHSVLICKFCREILLTKSKTELVELLITKAY